MQFYRLRKNIGLIQTAWVNKGDSGDELQEKTRMAEVDPVGLKPESIGQKEFKAPAFYYTTNLAQLNAVWYQQRQKRQSNVLLYGLTEGLTAGLHKR